MRIRCQCGVECDGTYWSPTAAMWTPHDGERVSTCGWGAPLDENGQPMSRAAMRGR